MSRPILDSSRFLVDPSIGNYLVHGNVDLTAPTYPTEEGKYIVLHDKAKKNEVIIIKAVIPYCQARQDVQDPASDAEYVQYISPSMGNGYFLFEPRVQEKAGYTFTANKLTPYTVAASASNDQRSSPSGITFITDDPWSVANRAIDSAIMGFIVPPENDFKVLFSLMPEAATGPISGRYQIVPAGDDPSIALRRVDYAGVLVVGLRMASSRYDELLKQRTENGSR